MKTQYLISNRYQKIGWFFLIPGIILGVILLYNNFEYPTYQIKVYSIIKRGTLSKTNVFTEITIFLITIGGLLVAFSKEKMEDEYIKKIRVESLIWAIFVNYVILLIATILLYDFNFLNFMGINMFSPLLLFILKFHWELYKLYKEYNDEK